MAKKKKYPKYEIEFLTKFDGIGPAKARSLLDSFKDSSQVVKAEAKQLQECLGEKTGIHLFREIHGEDAPLGNKEPSDTGRPPGYTTEIGESIADDYAEGEGTIEEIMIKHGFSEQTFYNWQDEYLEFFELIKNARAVRRGRNYQMALNGKKKLLEGYQVIEQTTRTEPYTDEHGQKQNRVKDVTVSKKHYPPNATMIIFELCNDPSGEYKSVQHVKYESQEKIPPYDLSKLSDEELEQFEKLSQKALTNGSMK